MDVKAGSVTLGLMGSSTVSWSKGAARAGERGVRVVVAVRARAVAATFWSQERRSSWSRVDMGMALRAVGLVVCVGVWWKGGRRGREERESGCLYALHRSPRGLLRLKRSIPTLFSFKASVRLVGRAGRCAVPLWGAYSTRLHSKVQTRRAAYL